MTIYRSEVLRRAQTAWPLGTVPYSQVNYFNGYREDCSGFVSMCWALGTSHNTATLVTAGLMYEINPNDLKPGDAIGLCGPGSEGDAGHIQLFISWDNQISGDNGHTVIEQTGPDGNPGPHRNHYATWHSGYKAYRCKLVADDPVPAPSTSPTFPLTYPPNCFGDISGPYWEHGGATAWERTWVSRIQDRLKQLGFDCGISDGVFGPHTIAATRAFQQARGLTVDGIVGPQTWHALFG